MEILSVLIAAVAAFVFGAVWYMALAKPWMEAADVEMGDDGKPANGAGAMTYIIALVATVVVAGMMRHAFALAGIDSPGKGLVAGLGIGLFMVVPWLATNYAFAGRPRNLTFIDGGYATGGCTVIGLVLTLM